MKGITIAASLLLYTLLSSSTVEAHGEEVLRERAGSYEVVVAILPERPAIGTVHFSITPLDASRRTACHTGQDMAHRSR